MMRYAIRRVGHLWHDSSLFNSVESAEAARQARERPDVWEIVGVQIVEMERVLTWVPKK